MINDWIIWRSLMTLSLLDSCMMKLFDKKSRHQPPDESWWEVSADDACDSVSMLPLGLVAVEQHPKLFNWIHVWWINSEKNHRYLLRSTSTKVKINQLKMAIKKMKKYTSTIKNHQKSTLPNFGFTSSSSGRRASTWRRSLGSIGISNSHFNNLDSNADCNHMQ